MLAWLWTHKSWFLVFFLYVLQLHKTPNIISILIYSFFLLYSRWNKTICTSVFVVLAMTGYKTVFLWDWHQICNGSLNPHLVHAHTHTHVIHLFMRSGRWSEASQAALWIISILHGKTNEWWTCPLATGDTIHSFTLGVCRGLCCVSLSECVELFTQCAAIWPLCQTPPGFFWESHPVVLTLCAQTRPTHAGPRWRDSEPPRWERGRVEMEGLEKRKKSEHLERQGMKDMG